MTTNRPASPLWATVNVTGVCNLQCEYCFFQPRKHEHMTIVDFINVIAILKAQNAFFLTISGGEPFMHPRIIILMHAHDTFEHATVLSNGTRIQKTHVDCMRAIIKRKGAFPLQISRDAIDPDTNDKTRGMAFKVMKNLQVLRDAGITLTIAMVKTAMRTCRPCCPIWAAT